MKSLTLQEIESLSLSELETQVRHHNQLYFELHQPEISDYDFDRLVERLKKIHPESPILNELGSDLRKGVNVPKIVHTSPMLSLDKCYSLDDLMSWAKKFEGDVLVTPKIDGCAVEIRYDEKGELEMAATRGDGVKGEDISANVRFVADIPKRLPSLSQTQEKSQGLEVRGEVYMPLSVFKNFKSSFANPRNLAAGAIKQKQASKTREYQLRFFAYDVRDQEFESEFEKMNFLHTLGFQTVEFRKLMPDADLLQSEWDRYLAQRNEVDYELDGVVYKTDRVSEQERLGASAHHPRYAIAYKFQGDSGVTILREVEWSVARTGVITPVGIVDPVELSGAKVSRVSLHNYGLLQKLSVTLPCEVLMIRRGGVIPYLEKVLENDGEPVLIPEHCPSCGCPAEVREEFLYCTNRENCQSSRIGELNHFIKTLEIDGFGEVLIRKLYEEKLIEDPADFYTLQKGDLLNLERMGEVLATKLLANIEAKRKVPLDLFLQSLGIRELARHASKLLVQQFGSLSRILSATEEELLLIHTFGEVMAREIVLGLQKRRPLIDKLLKHLQLNEGKIPQKGPLAGQSFLFTGKMQTMDRSNAEKKVEALGGAIASGVTKDLHFLVIGSEGFKNREKGNKWIKAEKLIEKGASLQIISEEEFLKKL